MSQPGPPPYGAQPPYPAVPPSHPQATTALVLGILGLVVCAVVAPFAWSTGAQAVREIDAAGGRWGGRTEANIGKILGIVGTAMLLGGLLFLAVFLVFGMALTGGLLASFSTR